MPVNIHGKQYITVAERVQEVHASLKEMDKLSITTEVVYLNPVVVKATVTINDNVFTGYSAANPTKAIEKMSPYEVAETSAVGRALGFAGFGIVDGIATADEMVKATTATAVSMSSYDQGTVCLKCKSTEMVTKTAGSASKRPGKQYLSCRNCNNFVKYIEDIVDEQISPETEISMDDINQAVSQALSE